jgi:hypothetical protein
VQGGLEHVLVVCPFEKTGVLAQNAMIEVMDGYDEWARSAERDIVSRGKIQ